VFSGCSQSPPDFLQPPFEDRQHGRFPDAGIEFGPAYHLGVGDMLKIEVDRFKEFGGEVRLDSQGIVRVPFTKQRLHLAELTIEEAEAALAEAISPYLIRQPNITVSVQKPESQFFYVMGAVKSPGKYAMGDEYIFVREAVARAGWPVSTAALKRAQLVSSKPDRHQMRELDLKDIIYRGNLTQNYKLATGDIVWVPHTWFHVVSVAILEFVRPFSALVNVQRTAERLHGFDDAFDFSDDDGRRRY
jgi:Polysaccharide biosynthesis/export protein/SLBB domain